MNILTAPRAVRFAYGYEPRNASLVRINVERPSLRGWLVESSSGSSDATAEIRAFLQAEIELLNDIMTDGMTVIDALKHACDTLSGIARRNGHDAKPR